MINSKRKGNRGENEIAHILQGYGFDTKRSQQYTGGGVDTPDVSGLPGIHIEVKRTERLNVHEAMAQAVRDAAGERIPAVFHRRNRGRWLVTMHLDDFMEIYKEWQKSITG